MHTYRIVSVVTLSLSVLMLNGCATSTAPGAVGADRGQLLLVSSEEMNRVAEQAYDELKAEADDEGILNKDAELLSRVRTIGARLRPQTAVFRPDAPDWLWELNVLHSDELNAFCMPGGKIMFYSGLIEQLDLTDAEIAIVMGHEVAHALREHSREQMSQALAAQTVIGVGATLFGLGQGSANLAATGYQALVATRFSRTDESEADQIGLELTARAGYDPRAGVTLWQKMTNANQGGRPPELLSTHPSEANRVQQIEALLPTVMPLYTAAGGQ
jgi:predicted Zn-dependent protease